MRCQSRMSCSAHRRCSTNHRTRYIAATDRRRCGHDLERPRGGFVGRTAGMVFYSARGHEVWINSREKVCAEPPTVPAWAKDPFKSRAIPTSFRATGERFRNARRLETLSNAHPCPKETYAVQFPSIYGTNRATIHNTNGNFLDPPTAIAPRLSPGLTMARNPKETTLRLTQTIAIWCNP